MQQTRSLKLGAAQVTAGDEATYSALVEDRQSANLLDTVHAHVTFRPLICTWHAGSGKDPSLAKASSLSVPLCLPSVVVAAIVNKHRHLHPPTHAASASGAAQSRGAVSSAIGPLARASPPPPSSRTVGVPCRNRVHHPAVTTGSSAREIHNWARTANCSKTFIGGPPSLAQIEGKGLFCIDGHDLPLAE